MHADEDTLDFVPSVVRRADPRARPPALRAHRPRPGPVDPGPPRRPRPRRAPAATSCPAIKETRQRRQRRARRTGRIVPCPTARLGAARAPRPRPGRGARGGSASRSSTSCRLDEDDPVAAWRERADTLVGAAERLTERRFDALHFDGDGTDLTVGLLPTSKLHGGALRDRRRHRAHAEPPDGGGLHARPTRSAPTASCARPSRSSSAGSIIRGLEVEFRGGPRRAHRRRRGRRRAARLRRARRGRVAPRRGRARRRRGPHRRARHGRSSTPCSTRTPRATSRSARPTRSRRARRTASA